MCSIKSSNVGAIRIGQRVGADRLMQYVRRFGFGAGARAGFRGTVPRPGRPVGRRRREHPRVDLDGLRDRRHAAAGGGGRQRRRQRRLAGRAAHPSRRHARRPPGNGRAEGAAPRDLAGNRADDDGTDGRRGRARHGERGRARAIPRRGQDRHGEPRSSTTATPRPTTTCPSSVSSRRASPR